MGEWATGAQEWWGEAPERAVVLPELPVDVDEKVRRADSLPSRGP